MKAWLKRFGLHLAAAVGATGVFVAAAAVGASQTRQQAVSPPVTVVARPARSAQPKPSVEPTTPTVVRPVRPERSLAGTVRDVQPDHIEIVGLGGRTWRIEPAPGALIRLNGKSARLDALVPGDTVVILGQAQRGPELRFLAHAITAKSH